MGFKVASRVRGLSDEAFREAFGTEEQCRSALVRLRWPGGFLCCPSYKFRPAQKSGPFRVVPDSVCDPHTILHHGVLSGFRGRAMR